MGVSEKIKLSDGRELKVDVSTLTMREWRGFWDVKVTDEESDLVLSRLTGLEASDIPDMLRDDYRLVLQTVTSLSNKPLADPNSASASTTDS